MFIPCVKLVIFNTGVPIHKISIQVKALHAHNYNYMIKAILKIHQSFEH